MPNYNINIGIASLQNAKKEVAQKIAAAYSTLRRQFIAEGSAFAQKWGDSARKKLKTSNNYVNHIREDFTEGEKEIIYTVSHEYLLSNGLSLTLLLENGYGPFDLKSSLFTAKNVKISKKGYLYRYVPFNYHNPYKEGVMVTPPHITNEMADAFHKIEKAGLISKKGFVILNPANLKNVGYEESDIKRILGEKKVKTGKHHIKDTNLSRTVPYPKMHVETLHHNSKKIFSVNYKWKNEQFLRMQKKKGGSGGKVYTTFSTIRTMSTNPNQKQAYIHPGLPALNIFKDVYISEKDNIPKRMEAYLNELLRDIT